MLGGNSLFLPSISSLGDDLTATVLANTMLGSVSPDVVQQYTSENRGSSPSIYGLLAGQPGYLIEYWAELKEDGRTAYYFTLPASGGQVAETYRPVQACNSWMYLTNRVLVPSSSGKVADVEKVALPETLPWSTTPSSPSSPVPSPPPDPAMVQNATICEVPSPDAAPTSSECQTFDQAARDAGLTLLSLVAANLEDALPEPANTNTIFAPTDAAFTGMLGDLGLSIPDALTLGDKLTSVLLYHVHPGEALSIDELNQRQSLTTDLGARLNEVDAFTIAVQSGAAMGAPPTLTSVRGDVATITKTITVCNTTVHVIDKVLLPAATVEELPIAPPPTVTVTVTDEAVVQGSQPPKEQSVVQRAVASVIGPLISCTVILEAAGSTLTTVTDESGAFRFEKIPQCATKGGYVRVPRDSQGEECRDAATGLPPVYDLTTSLALLGEGMARMPDDDAPLLVSPLSTLLSSPALQQATMADDLGFASNEETLLGSDTSLNNRHGIESQALNTALLLGTMISAVDGVSLQAGVEAVNAFIAANLRNKLSLSDPSTAERILNATLLTSNDQAKLDAISASTAALNEVLVETWYTDSPSSYDDKRLLTGNVATISQQDLSPAIVALIDGTMAVEEFVAGYGPGAVRSKFPTSAEALAPTSVPPIAPAISPAGADPDFASASSHHGVPRSMRTPVVFVVLAALFLW